MQGGKSINRFEPSFVKRRAVHFLLSGQPQRILHPDGQGIAGAFIAALPPERIPPIKAVVRRAYLAGGADGPRSFVAVARLASGRKAIRP